jgi:hypothetical protein
MAAVVPSQASTALLAASAATRSTFWAARADFRAP